MSRALTWAVLPDEAARSKQATGGGTQQQSLVPYLVAKDVLSVVNKLPDPTNPSREALVEINKSLLNASYKFVPNSTLKSFIEMKRKKSKEIYTLAEVSFFWLPQVPSYFYEVIIVCV